MYQHNDINKMFTSLLLKLHRLQNRTAFLVFFSIDNNLNESLPSFEHLTRHILLHLLFHHVFAFVYITLINNYELYISYTRHIDNYIQKKSLFNLYLLHTWPLSSRADNHHDNIQLFCHNSHGFHKSCCSSVNSLLRKTPPDTLKGITSYVKKSYVDNIQIKATICMYIAITGTWKSS